MARPSKENALKCLKRALDKAAKVRGLEYRDSEFQKWKTSTHQELKRIFGVRSDNPRDFGGSLIINLDEDKGSNVGRAAALLSSWIEEVEEDWPETERASEISNVNRGVPRSSNKVFVIHGHDEAAREAVARFLEKLDLEPVILHEQANKGRTIIEKFEGHADVAFAVVLLTPDDVGRPKDGKSGFKCRARQNVILELGFFLGKLGRKQVYSLVKGDVETPSDYDGVVYTKLDDSDGWKMKLVGELKAAGFDIDANRAFQT